MSTVSSRRSFLSAVASVAGLTALEASAVAAAGQTAVGAKWDLAWLDAIPGRHRQVFDLGSMDLSTDLPPLRFVYSYFEAYREVSGLVAPDVSAAVGTMFSAFPLQASDALWQKYKLGERWNVIDPATRQPAVRNIYLDDTPAAAGIKRLQSMGTTFWQCNVALGRVVMTLSQATQTPPATVRTELIAGLNPGVRLVPAHVMAVSLAQERGFSYVKP